VRRRSYVVLGAVVALAAAGVAAALAVAVFGRASQKPPTRAQYLARVAAICRTYGKKLDEIPPPIDIASYGNAIASMKPALAILRDQAARIRAIEPPPELEVSVEHFFRLTDRSLARLAAALDAAERRDIAGLGIGLQRFDEATLAAKKEARRIGWHC
jgi:hypothetical protein